MLEKVPRDEPRLPEALRYALREWRILAASVSRRGDAKQREAVRRSGRVLAARVAGLLGQAVEFVDPVTGRSEQIGPAERAQAPRRSATTVTGSTGAWSTGLPIAAFAAMVTVLGNCALAHAFADAFGLLWVPANVVVGVGVAPSLYLLRRVPFWRWPAMGVAAGLVVAWPVLLALLL